jgi:hypothetical protein
MKWRLLQIFICANSFLFAQVNFDFENNVERKRNKRTAFVSTAHAVLYGISFSALRQVWYTDNAVTNFHFFNDNNEWLQMDKAGHAVTAYNIARLTTNMYNWCGIYNSTKKNAFIGSAVSLFYLTSLEMLDGYSSGWGFSMGDMAANIGGIVILNAQELLWGEQRILLKFSFHPSIYAKYRPALLGKNTVQQILKDYNGQTYWLSVNIADFLTADTRFPKWLNIALGYSAEGMIGGSYNPIIISGTSVIAFERYRQYYLSIDFDLRKIKTKNKFLKSLFNAISIIKFPAPALEFSRNKIKAKAFYF